MWSFPSDSFLCHSYCLFSLVIYNDDKTHWFGVFEILLCMCNNKINNIINMKKIYLFIANDENVVYIIRDKFHLFYIITNIILLFHLFDFLSSVSQLLKLIKYYISCHPWSNVCSFPLIIAIVYGYCSSYFSISRLLHCTARIFYVAFFSSFFSSISMMNIFQNYSFYVFYVNTPFFITISILWWKCVKNLSPVNHYKFSWKIIWAIKIFFFTSVSKNIFFHIEIKMY